METGMPFSSTAEAVQKRLRWPSHVELCEEVKDLISRMVEPNPAQRIHLVDVVAHPWTQVYAFLSRFLSLSRSCLLSHPLCCTLVATPLVRPRPM